jgi:hypothetical protein
MFSGDSGYDPVGEWHLPRTALNMDDSTMLNMLLSDE